MERDVSWEGFELRFLKVHCELETNWGKKRKGMRTIIRGSEHICTTRWALNIFLLFRTFREKISMPCIERGTLDLHTFWQDFVPARRFTALSIWEDEIGCLFDRSLRVITLFTPLVKVPEINRLSFAPCHKLASIPCFSCFQAWYFGRGFCSLIKWTPEAMSLYFRIQIPKLNAEAPSLNLKRLYNLIKRLLKQRVFLVFGSLGTDAHRWRKCRSFSWAWLPTLLCKTTVQEPRMCKLRTNFQLNHAICLASRPKSRCFFFKISSKITLFFQDIERHQQTMKQ